MKDKIKTIEELSEIVNELKKINKKIVHCHGVFDVLHPGHIKHFKDAKSQGDILIVTITKDKYIDKGPNRPVFNENTRAEFLAALEEVNYVAINDSPTAENLIKILKPDIYAKGSEFKEGKDVTGRINLEINALEEVGGKVYYTVGETFSSSHITNVYSDFFREDTRKFLDEYKQRISTKEILERLNSLKDLNVLIIGDAIIDEYRYVIPLSRPPKDSIIAGQYSSHETFLGGALATANHIAGFCDKVDLLTCVGLGKNGNDYINFIIENLKSNIKPKLFFRDDQPTILKRRFIEPIFMNKLFEEVLGSDKPLSNEINVKVVEELERIIESYDLVIVYDLGHGFITEEMIKTISEKSKLLVVSTQTNETNQGYNPITKYPRADYVYIDHLEIRFAVHDRYGDMKEIIKKLLGLRDYKKISITGGNEGCLSYSKEEDYKKVPILSGKKVVDTMGAGTAFLSLASVCFASGNDLEFVSFIGNVAGALSVNMIGNKESLDMDKVSKYISTLLK